MKLFKQGHFFLLHLTWFFMLSYLKLKWDLPGPPRAGSGPSEILSAAAAATTLRGAWAMLLLLPRPVEGSLSATWPREACSIPERGAALQPLLLRAKTHLGYPPIWLGASSGGLGNYTREGGKGIEASKWTETAKESQASCLPHLPTHQSSPLVGGCRQPLHFSAPRRRKGEKLEDGKLPLQRTIRSYSAAWAPVLCNSSPPTPWRHRHFYLHVLYWSLYFPLHRGHPHFEESPCLT